MGELIHCRIVGDEMMKFRVWSTFSYKYLTDDLTEAELMQYLLHRKLSQTIAEFFEEFPQRVAIAKEKGSSSRIHRAVPLDSPWYTKGSPS